MYSPTGHGAPTAAHALPSLDVENVVTPSHAPHWRSAVAEPAAVWPWPAGHVRHAAHAWLPAVALNSPAAHAAHSRSDDAPGATVWYSPFWHAVMAEHTRSACECGGVDVYCPLGHVAACVAHVRSEVSEGASVSNSPSVHVSTATQPAPLSTFENEASCVHAAHWRSAVAEPGTVMPVPAAHVDHTVDSPWPADVVKLPSSLAAHVRSLLAVATAVVCVPAAHGSLTAAHAAPLAAAEYVDPTVQRAQARLDLSEPALDMPKATAHVAHAVHLSSPAEAVKVPAPHAAQVRSLLAVAAAVV